VFVLIQGYLPWNVEEGNRREIKIVQAYQSIKHPEGAELLNYELNRKIITRWLFSKYIYPIDNDAVKKYYDQEFVSKGWKQISYNSKPDPEHIFGAYIKDNLKLVLGLHNGNIWTISIHYIAEENY
jgi:hypothetical protein